MPKNIIKEYNLEESMEIPRESYLLLAESSALSFSYWLLAKKDYSTRDLETKLLTKYKEKTIISKVIEELNNRCYLDDDEFAKSFIESHKNWGKKKIEYQLALKGIKISLVRELLEGNEDNEILEIQKLWEKMGDKEYRKKVESLMRKGFEYSTIKRAVENLS